MSHSSPSGSSDSSQQLVDLVDGHPGVDHHRAVVETLGRHLLHVVLVGDLADELLDEVLQGDQTGGAAELVHDNRHVVFAGLHFPHQLGDPLALRRELGLAHDRRRPAPRCRPSRSARMRSLAYTMPTMSSMP